jgi:hypothetical protein
MAGQMDSGERWVGMPFQFLLVCSFAPGFLDWRLDRPFITAVSRLVSDQIQLCGGL